MNKKINAVLWSLSAAFLLLAGAFFLDIWGHPEPLPVIPLVGAEFTTNSPLRESYAELVRIGEDLSDFDCYACHERDKPPVIKFDENHNVIIPREHSNIVMSHGRHNRNNHCFNCHDENNLELLQARDGRELKMSESTALCGSCHGPTYRDWDAGVHGRTSGFWDRNAGSQTRLECVACHDPHSPKSPSRKPAPGPVPLRPVPPPAVAKGEAH
jgi:hypothetical protein